MLISTDILRYRFNQCLVASYRNSVISKLCFELAYLRCLTCKTVYIILQAHSCDFAYVTLRYLERLTSRTVSDVGHRSLPWTSSQFVSKQIFQENNILLLLKIQFGLQLIEVKTQSALGPRGYYGPCPLNVRKDLSSAVGRIEYKIIV